MKAPYTLLDYSGEVKALTNWDMTLIKDLLDGRVWQPANGFQFFEADTNDAQLYEGGIFIIPARQNAGHEGQINEYLSLFKWCLVMLLGDEERLFDKSKLTHPNMKVWLMQPKLDDDADFYLGSGYTRHVRDKLYPDVDGNYQVYKTKPLDWFFAGQVNHPRRQQCVEILKAMQGREDVTGSLIETEGFTQGLPHTEYVRQLAGAKAVACPSGIQSPDSFRVYEALEAGAVPVADDLSTVLVHESGYWRKVFNGEDVPFKIFDDYANLEGYILDVHREYPAYSNKVFAWWQGYKRRMAYVLRDHVAELSGHTSQSNLERDNITIIIVTSPIKSHPSLKIIGDTINDLRKVLPDCEIIIGIDGVRPEQEHYRERYEEYKKRLLWGCNHGWRNVLPVVFDTHMHQSGMMRKLLDYVKTPMLMFVEHDTSLCPDFEYDWYSFIRAIDSGEAYTIRFHFEAVIPEPHKPLMIDETVDVMGVPLLKTVQWSQRPHLSSTTFYRDMMQRYFTDDSRTMIEDVIHGKVMEDWINDGIHGWYKWRLWIYSPDGNIKRSYTSDGRGDDPKYEMRF